MYSSDKKGLPRLEIQSGYWERAAQMRREILKRKLKARAMDCMIAQVCMDHKVALVCRDQDFRHFKKYDLEIVE